MLDASNPQLQTKPTCMRCMLLQTMHSGRLDCLDRMSNEQHDVLYRTPNKITPLSALTYRDLVGCMYLLKPASIEQQGNHSWQQAPLVTGLDLTQQAIKSSTAVGLSKFRM